MLLNQLKKIESGKAKTFICENILNLQSEFQHLQADDFENHFIVTHLLKKIPKEKDLLDDFVKSLAGAVYERWPLWYNKSFEDFEEVFLEEICLELKSDFEGLSKAWLKKSVKFCNRRKIPCFKELPNKIQAEQLALSLSPLNLIFTVYVPDFINERDNLLGLARAAEWFSRETGGSVALLLPYEFKDFKELDSILYNSVFISDENKKRYKRKKHPEESKYNIWPIEGKPHPLSPGENKLAEFLAEDDELNGVFEFNRKITTVLSTNYFVDLLWPEGRLVVEIDGYRYHRSRHAFQVDRTRDYELAVSNYLILRLTHDEVMDDIKGAVKKIRNMMDFVSKNRNIKGKTK